MAKIIGVRFRNAGKIYYFDPGRYIIKENSAVIVETVQGIEYADVVIGTREVADSEIVAPLKGIVRVATQADIRQAKQQREKEALAFAAAESKIAAHKLEMNWFAWNMLLTVLRSFSFSQAKGVWISASWLRTLRMLLKQELSFGRSARGMRLSCSAA